MEPPQIPGASSDPARPSAVVWEGRLVHAEAGRRVVEASAWRRGECLGRSLGEGESAEAAEDRALARLQRQLGQRGQAVQEPLQSQPPASTLIRRTAAPAPAGAVVQPQLPAIPQERPPGTSEATEASPPHPEALEPSADPDDWSDELAELDVQLQRLGWDRNQEGRYLERAFGHPSRSRLTAFADLVAYLKALRALPAGSQPEQAPVPLRRRDLLSQSDQLLSTLGWDAGRGRALLEQQFQLSSRQQLSDEQLLHFNMLLESELINAGSAPAATAGPG